MKEIKIGDKVKYNGKYHDTDPQYYPKAGTIGTVIGFGINPSNVSVKWPNGTTSRDDTWYARDVNLSVVSPVIVISVDKDNPNRVVAKDKFTGETADAKCNPDDEFDFYVGAKLAFDRLVANQPKYAKCKFKVGDIIIGNEKANDYGITVKGWVGVVIDTYAPKDGYGCDRGKKITFSARAIDDEDDKNWYQLNAERFDLAANSK